MTQPVTVGTHRRGVRREKSDGSASHPHQGWLTSFPLTSGCLNLETAFPVAERGARFAIAVFGLNV